MIENATGRGSRTVIENATAAGGCCWLSYCRGVLGGFKGLRWRYAPRELRSRP